MLLIYKIECKDIESSMNFDNFFGYSIIYRYFLKKKFLKIFNFCVCFYGLNFFLLIKMNKTNAF